MALKNFQPNSAGFQALAVSPEIGAVLLEVAEKGRAIAEGLAAEFTESGDYAASFNTRNDITNVRTRFGVHAVVSGVLENTSDHAAAVEFGNRDDHKAHHVLAKTGEALAG